MNYQKKEEKKEVKIRIANLDNYSYIDKNVNCDTCVNNGVCTDMTKCPLIARIASDVLRTTYCMKKSTLCINTGTFEHDFRRAINVVNSAINSWCRGR